MRPTASTPARGDKPVILLKEILLELREIGGRVQLPMAASSLAYTTILSIIPVLAVSFAVFHAFGGMEKVLDTLEPYILRNLAHGTGEEVTVASGASSATPGPRPWESAASWA